MADERGDIHKLRNPLNWLRRNRAISAAAEWRVLGAQVGLSNAILDEIHHDYGRVGAHVCLYQVLARWQRTDPHMSWEKLDEAVSQMTSVTDAIE